uniref:Transmembrane protein 79 n=1 Tax=Junco hyemalis TaxID=40217 RepID=A0A8C5ICP8_JUNHY
GRESAGIAQGLLQSWESMELESPMAPQPCPSECCSQGGAGGSGMGWGLRLGLGSRMRYEHLGDPDATLPWDQSQHNARGQLELVETKKRSSPEGGHEDPEEAVPTCPTAEAEDEEVPQLPVMASHVFVPIDPQCIEQSPFKQNDRPLAEGSQCPCARDCGTDNLKAVASVAGALLLCPCLIYGAYIFLPFDAPLLPTVSARLVYTLRCATFATFPIVLGEPWAGVRALCSWSRLHERRDSPQHHPKSSLSEPLSASPTASPGSQPALSAFSRLIFWMSYAIGRSFRAFGFSMTFLPLLAMLLWNLYSMFVLEPENLLSLALPTPESRSKESRAKLRHWG